MIVNTRRDAPKRTSSEKVLETLMTQKCRKQVKNYEIEPTRIFALFTAGLIDVSLTLVSGYFHRDDHWKGCTKRTTSKVRLQLAEVELVFYLCKIKILQSFATLANYSNFLRRKQVFQWFLFMISSRTRTISHCSSSSTCLVQWNKYAFSQETWQTWRYWEDSESQVSSIAVAAKYKNVLQPAFAR